MKNMKELMKDYINVIMSSEKLHSFIVISRPGLGKTYTIKTVLEEQEMPFVLLTNYSTPLALYEFLCLNSDKLIVMDDAEKIFEDKLSASILLAALWNGASGVRKVCYHSTSDKLTVGPEFEFTGKIITLLNRLPPRYAGALESRSLFYSYNLSRDEVLSEMRAISAAIGVPAEIVDYIEQVTTEASELDLRHLIKAIEIHRLNNGSWKELVDEQIKADELLLDAYEVISAYDRPAAQVAAWIAKTHLSRAMFYKMKKKLTENGLKKTGKVNKATLSTCLREKENGKTIL